MCKEMPVIPGNKVVDPKRIIEKNGGPSRRRGTRGSLTKKKRFAVTVHMQVHTYIEEKKMSENVLSEMETHQIGPRLTVFLLNFPT
jgi:hypothetical protein